MRKTISLSLALCIVLTSLLCLVTANAQEGSILIYTEEDLYNVRNNLSGSYILMNDIYLESYDNWEPIGDNNAPFTGSFYGQDYGISGLDIEINDNIAASDDFVGYYGLFGCTGSSAQIRNTNINYGYITVDIIAPDANITLYGGALVGYNAGTIANCDVIGNITIDADTESGQAKGYLGGIVGYNSRGLVAGCNAACQYGSLASLWTSSADESAFSYAGGVIGYNDSGRVDTCCAYGAVQANAKSTASSARDYVGGLIGNDFNGTIANCCSNGDVYADASAEGSGAASYAGGLIGDAQSEITNCFAVGDIESKAYSTNTSRNVYSYAGGLAGATNGGMNIKNCYALGNVKSGAAAPNQFSDTYAGGLIGWNPNSKLTDCYAIGDVTANRNGHSNYAYVSCGGLVGDAGGSITNCYAVGNVKSNIEGNNVNSCVNALIGRSLNSDVVVNTCYYNADNGLTDEYATGLTAAQMKNTAEFANFDFDSVWTADGGYPYLQSQFVRIMMLQSSVYMYERNVRTITALTVPDVQLVWSSDDESVATVNDAGVVTAVSEGTTIITAQTADGKYYAHCNVTVAAPKTYYIYTAEDLNNVRNDMTGIYYLMNDIDLSGFTNWVPIGASDNPDYAPPFQGTLDGQGYKIIGLNIDIEKQAQLENGHQNIFGLFASIYGGTVKNVGIEGKISVKATAAFEMHNVTVGGLAARIGDAIITNCYCDVDITAVNVSEYDVESTGTTYVDICTVGGIAGNFSGRMENCYSAGDISASIQTKVDWGDIYAGGLVGSNEGTITNCYALGSLTTAGTSEDATSQIYAGGLVGSNSGSINTSYANVGVTPPAKQEPGKLYAVSGGICAANYSGTVNNCYYNSDIGEWKTINVGWNETEYKKGGLTTEQMKTAVSFVGFDFDNIWSIDAAVNNGYPYLRSSQTFEKVISAEDISTSNQVICRVTLNTDDYSGKLVAVLYKNGKRVSNIKIYDSTSGLNIMFDKGITGDYVKIMYWDALNSQMPLCEAATVQLK